MNECLDDDALARMIAGTLAEDERVPIVAHLERCDACRSLVADAMQLADETRTIAGRYRLLGEIGRGAMGIVFRAHDVVLERLVAIKLLGGTGAQPRARARLVRESRALAKLRHPNVVAVHDAGWDGEQFWVAMEYVAGVTLREWLAQRTASTEEIVAVFTKAARGLAAAHAVGVVHRDFKPDNVLLDGDGEPRVADFGLAQCGRPLAELTETDRAPEIGGDLTRTGAVIGTPAYMPPEQLGGRPIDARADVFAVCAALWEALHGVRPFDESSVEARLAAIERGAFVFGSRRLAPALRRTLARGLSFDRDRRQPDMRTLVAELEAFARRAPQRRRIAWSLAGASSCLFAAGAIAAAKPEPCRAPTTDRLAHAAAPEEVAKIERAVRAHTPAIGGELAWSQLRPELDAAITAADREAVHACEARGEDPRLEECMRIERSTLAYRLELAAEGDIQAAQGLSSRAPATWCRALASTWVEHEIDPSHADERDAVEQALAETAALAELARTDPMRERATEALERAEALGDPVLVARARFERGHATFAPDEATALLEQAAAEAATVGEHSTAAKAWIFAAYYGSPAASTRQLAHAELELAAVEDDDVHAWLDGLAAHARGRVLLAQGDPTGARAEFERAIAMAHELAPGRVPEYWWYITYAHWAAGEFAAALATQRDLVAWHERERGPNRYVHARALWNLADLEREHGELARALQSIQRARTIARASDDLTAEALRLVAEAEIRIARGELDDAEAAIDRAAASPGTMSPGVLSGARGVLALARDEHHEAAALLRGALDDLDDLDDLDVDLGLDAADLRAALAEALRRDGKPSDALATAEPELHRLRTRHAALPERGRVAAATGWALLDLDRPREAADRFEEALAVLVDPDQRARAQNGRATAIEKF